MDHLCADKLVLEVNEVHLLTDLLEHGLAADRHQVCESPPQPAVITLACVSSSSPLTVRSKEKISNYKCIIFLSEKSREPENENGDRSWQTGSREVGLVITSGLQRT